MFGSSPRVWGTFFCNSVYCYSNRFIPTGVGNISRIKDADTRRAVHPHGCGEHDRIANYIASSRRFIPTGVGNICCLLTGHRRQPVHPHGCGEHKKQEF